MVIPAILTQEVIKLIGREDLGYAASGSKDFESIRYQIFMRADLQEDQKELAGEADAFYYREEEGVLLEVWAAPRIGSIARNVL